MDVDAMKPFGLAMLAYFEGDAGAELIIRRDDGNECPMPVSYFFREPAEFTAIEKAAMQRCAGRVLDVGAGTGLHSLYLRQQGLSVTALDICPEAVDVMRRRGLTDVRCGDIFDLEGQRFDTLLMLGHGIGMVETMAGLDRFLARVHDLVSDGGQILLDSLDVRTSTDPQDLAYHQANRDAGRYVGEIRMQCRFQQYQGKMCGWLHVDAATLRQHAEAAGWRCEVVVQEESGNHLTRLAKPAAE